MAQDQLSENNLLVSLPSSRDIEVFNSSRFSGSKGLRANRSFSTGSKIFQVTGNIVKYRTVRTLQISYNDHVDPVDPEGNPTFGYYLNHSCNPNAYSIVVEDSYSRSLIMEIHALEEINEGDEITIDYAFMESEIANPCKCACGEYNCRGKIVGFQQLSEAEIADYLRRNIPLAYHLTKFLPVI